MEDHSERDWLQERLEKLEKELDEAEYYADIRRENEAIRKWEEEALKDLEKTIQKEENGKSSQ
jgi:hypothetical protein